MARGHSQRRYRRGERVPSTRELSGTLGVARSTVTSAYEQLIAEGYLESTHGSGTFVCRELPEQLLHARPARPAAQTHTKIRLSTFASGLPSPQACVPGIAETGWLRFSRWRPDLN